MCRIDPAIYQLCLDHHRDVEGELFVVPQSIPIPYFGNLGEYLESNTKVLTAALNPSWLEFPAAQQRFNIGLARQGPAYLEAELSAYFEVAPYRRWFLSFEPVLNGLDASYGGAMSGVDFGNRALHVDVCSPVATKPTWSKLADNHKVILQAVGHDVFEQLLDALEPDIVIASLGFHHLGQWRAALPAYQDWKEVLRYEHAASGHKLSQPLSVRTTTLASQNGREFCFAYGTAAKTPFGRFTNQRKLQAGEHLLARLRAGP